MTEPKAEQTETISEFRAPSSVEWRPLAAASDCDDAQKKEARSNKDELNNTLLASLQMQHLMVLAGLGCSL